MKAYFYTMIALTFVSSCMFPGKATEKRVNDLITDLPVIRTLITNQFRESQSSISTYNLRNEELKNKLKRYGVTDISIQYVYGIRQDSILSGDQFLTTCDSTISLSWTSGGQDQVVIRSLIYFFSVKKPLHTAIDSPFYRERQFNDSVWYLMETKDIIIVY